MNLDVAPDEEKRRLQPAGLEHVEHLRRPHGIGAVVESQRDLALSAAPWW
jgi:hypothetical protein